MQKQTRKNKDEKAIASAEDSVWETHSISIKPFMFYFDVLDQKLTQRGETQNLPFNFYLNAWYLY